EVFYILGVWDQDEALSIISSQTRLAQALLGHEVGDQVEVPAGLCEIKAVLPLPESIRLWIKG
ncbi:MAG: GreA/GreB family elongation factor, partial [Lentisphaerae bacterium]|nr:GreA/GreB family elongation factor [Lentisphaerota bacterium]